MHISLIVSDFCLYILVENLDILVYWWCCSIWRFAHPGIVQKDPLVFEV